MKHDYTHIAVILDRTGSMESIREDTIGGFNAFVNQQKGEPGAATLTLVQFDSQDPYEVIHKFKPVGAVPALTRETFVPRANTPLLDAMGRGINDLEKCLTEMKDEEKPSRVVMVIITDGQENASCEFRKGQIATMIQEKQSQSAWQFVFLSADLAAIDDALASGIHADATIRFCMNAQGTAAAWSSASARVADYRADRCKDVSFTAEDRAQQESVEKRK